MRKHRSAARPRLVLVIALALALVVSSAGVALAGSGTEKVQVGNLIFEGGGAFSPKVLSKTKQTPIGITVEGKIKTVDGSHPPALKEAIIETDKNGMINVTGYPVCKAGKLQAQDTKHAEAACRPAIIGTGTTDVQILFEESKPVPVHSKLLVFNGGVRGGTTTLLIHAYITFPVPAAIVTTVKISKVHNGPYGTKSIATIPKIAGGSGSVTAFKLTIDKKFTYKGKKVSILTAKCPTGRLQAHATAIFSDDTRASTQFVRPCTGRG